MDSIKKTNLVQKYVKDFYNENAESWDNSRQFFWKGWDIAFENILNNDKYENIILDLGSGNSRLLDYWLTKFQNSKLTYKAVEFSKELINKAKSKIQFYPINWHLEYIESNIFNFLKKDKNKYNIITILGVMHHLDSENSVKKLLEESLERLSKDGLIIVSFWEVLSEKRISKKLNKISDNEYLLDWKDSKSHRYVRTFDDNFYNKINKKFKDNIFKVFYADGKNDKINKYYLLKK